jgi:chromosome partitioning protein
LNSLVAADSVLVPLQCEYYALEGLSHLIATIDRVRAAYNQQLAIEGIVLCMYDKRTVLTRQVAADVREHFGGEVFDTVIPRNVRLSEAPSFGRPVLLHDIDSAGSRGYLQLARELLERQPKSKRPRARSLAGARVRTRRRAAEERPE